MFFEKHLPHPALRGFIRCYWTLATSATIVAREEQRFLTEAVQLSFNLADPVEFAGTGGEPITARRSCICGPMTKPMRIRTLGRLEVLGVCFRSGRAYPFIPYSAGELTNGCARTDDIWGSQGLEIVDRIREDSRTTQERIDILDLHFLHLLGKDMRKDLSTAAAVDRIEVRRGQVNIDHLARSVGWSSRQLERCFRDRVGMSPKRLCRNVRFKNAFRQLASFRTDCLAWQAVDCGYYDQSHMIRDFKHYTGTSPAAFFRKAQAMDGLFTGNF